jgi:hypothetical protein
VEKVAIADEGEGGKQGDGRPAEATEEEGISERECRARFCC